jgi:predicted regulator of Ras-like GTPase activity (Roadblock/LC7/MglB family)
MQTTPILTIQAAERLLSALEDYLDKSEAELALVVDRGGIILSQHGEVKDVDDASIIAALAAGSFAATRELALRVGEHDCAALYQQGSNSHILISSIDDDTLLVTVFGGQTTVGLVKFYSARTAKRVAEVLEDMRATPRPTALFSREDVSRATSLFGR